MTTEMARGVWLGKALVKPGIDSEQSRRGFVGAYGLVCCSSFSFKEGVAALSEELLENSLILDGFEWFLRTSDIDRDLSEDEKVLVSKLTTYPVQFHDFHWFKVG